MPGPLLASTIGFAVGAASVSLGTVSWPAVFLLVLLGAITLGARASTGRMAYATAGIFVLAVASGMGRTLLQPSTIPGPFAPLIGTEVSLEGTIAADPDLRESGQRLAIEVVRDAARTRVLAVAPVYPSHEYGERVRVSGTLSIPEPFATDGGREFRYDRFLAKDGIFALIERAEVETIAPPHGIFVRAYGALLSGKHAFVVAIGRALPEPYAGLASGILAGGKQGLGNELLDAFTVAGLLPIVVLSGYNVMIVAEAALAALRFLPKRIALALAALAVLAFILAVGTGASAIRAGFMAGLALFARASGRTYDAFRALLAALLLMLLIDPLLLAYDPGFQFSFVATTGLILLSPLVLTRLLWLRNAFLRDILASTIAAQAAVLPLLLYQTGNLSLVALPANVLALPLVPPAMLFSAIAGLTALIVPPLAALAGLPAFILLGYLIAVADAAARLPFASAIVPAFPFWVVLVVYGLLAFFARRMKRNTPAPQGAGVSDGIPSRPRGGGSR